MSGRRASVEWLPVSWAWEAARLLRDGRLAPSGFLGVPGRVPRSPPPPSSFAGLPSEAALPGQESTCPPRPPPLLASSLRLAGL